jgi:hypothetical protein
MKRSGDTYQVDEASVRPHQRVILDRLGHVGLLQRLLNALLDLQILRDEGVGRYLPGRRSLCQAASAGDP